MDSKPLKFDVGAETVSALLDLPKTLEMLETLGVPVIAYGSDEFPAFWSRSSGLPAPIRLDDPPAIAAFLAARQTLGLRGGVLVGNPVPAADEIPAAEMSGHIEAANKAAKAAAITGKAVTPYLLDAILRSTSGRSLITNIALMKNNARLAAEGKHKIYVSGLLGIDGKLLTLDPNPDISQFVTLKAGESYSSDHEFRVLQSDERLKPGSAVLQFTVLTWHYVKVSNIEWREKWRDKGYLWTNFLESQPVPFVIDKNPQIVQCR